MRYKYNFVVTNDGQTVVWEDTFAQLTGIIPDVYTLVGIALRSERNNITEDYDLNNYRVRFWRKWERQRQGIKYELRITKVSRL